MNNLQKYLDEIKKRLPDVEKRLNARADEGQLEKLRSMVNCEIPEELLELYRCFDGEIMEKELCFFAGLQFMPLDMVLYELEFFRGAEDELTAMGTRAIREEPMRELNWIPFAYDCSRAWLAMDLSPTEEGTAGQIITVDYDVDYCYLLADSMDGLLGKMTEWLQRGILGVNTKDLKEPFIEEKSGHLFNSLEELTAPVKSLDGPEIPLPEGVWRKRYGKSSVSVQALAKEKRILLHDEEIDCTPFAYMENMKELILHDCRLTNLGALAKMPQLKKLIFARCVIEGEGLSVLAEAPNLKELGLNIMSGAGLAEVSRSKTLKSLQVRALTDICVEELAAFTFLQEFRVEKMGLKDASFIGNMKNLKKLDLWDSELTDLDFLKSLKKLTNFHLKKRAESEDGLLAVGELTKLKEFIYPVKDISIYAGHKTLECVGMAADVAEGFEAFAGSKVNSFTLLGGATEVQTEAVRKQMDKYVKLYSWGTEG